MRLRYALLTLVLTLWSPHARAGGSGLNVIVVANAASSNSLALANYYAEQRQLPPQNVLRMTGWAGGRVSWDYADFTNRLLHPLHAALASRGLTQQVWHVLLSMDIPYRVERTTVSYGQNSTTSALFYGWKGYVQPPPGLPWECSLPGASSNSYAFSELSFPEARPAGAATNALLAFMLTADSLGSAKALVDRGVASDTTFPTQKVYLARTGDGARNVRYWYFDDASFSARVLGLPNVVVANQDSLLPWTNSLGILTGLANFAINPNTFVPGALADSLTSYGGMIWESLGQTTLLGFLNAGATASYGTVVEPCNYLEKFPHPLDYFFLARGFNVAEAYFQSLQNPFQGLFVGEPLAAPFARRGNLDLPALANGTVLTGSVPLTVQGLAADVARPIGQLDLFLDGTFVRTLTNFPPSAGDQLTLSFAGQPVSLTVPTNATLPAVARAMGDALNLASNVTRVHCYTYGDRLELHGLDPATPPSALTTIATTVPAGSAPLTTFATPARPNFIASTATGWNYVYASNAPAVGAWIRITFLKTNGASVSFAATNTAAAPTNRIAPLLQSLYNQINSSPLLQAVDGVSADSFYNGEPAVPHAQFLVRSRRSGWPAAQIVYTFESSPGFYFEPGLTNHLDGNLFDLESRNHIYLAHGLPAINATFALDTTTLPDGVHDLTVISYEGTSVRTQTRASRQVVIQNTPLTATLTTLVGGPQAAVEGTLVFRVNTTNGPVASLELFTTGGSVGRSNNTAVANFSLSGTTLGEGLHPFYAVATDNAGQRYRTATTWIRLRSAEAPFRLTALGNPAALAWPALAARQYQILASGSLTLPFTNVTTVVADSNTARWLLPAAPAGQVFYRVRTLVP